MMRALLSVTIAVFLLSDAYAQTVAPPPPPPAPLPNPEPAPRPKPPKPKPAKKAAPIEPTVDAKARLFGKAKDWTIFLYEGADGRVCFAAGAPSDMQPKGTKRTAVVFYLTTWQKDGVKNEVSVKQGYSLKPGAPATVTVASQNYSLTAQDDKAFMKDPGDERKLIASMSGGGSMTVKATSAKGTVTTDQYSLAGLPEALQKMQEACP